MAQLASIRQMSRQVSRGSPQCCGCWPRLPGAHGPHRSLLRLGHSDTDTRPLRSGGCPSKIQAPPEAAPWAGRGPSSPRGPADRPLVWVCALLSSSHKDPRHFGSEATRMTLFNLNYFSSSRASCKNLRRSSTLYLSASTDLLRSSATCLLRSALCTVYCLSASSRLSIDLT